MKNPLLYLIGVCCFAVGAFSQARPFDEKLGNAFVSYKNEQLTVGTGNITRVWKWTGKGFATVSLVNPRTRKEWCDQALVQEADWSLPRVSTLPAARIVSIEARESTDDNFTSRHLNIVAEVAYPELSTTIKYMIWAYPDAPGLRTQLFVKSTRKLERIAIPISGIPPAEMKIVDVCSPDKPDKNAGKMVDGDVYSYWQSPTEKTRPLEPNHVILDLGKPRNITALTLGQKRDYRVEGWVDKCVVYASDDPAVWGPPVGNAAIWRAPYLQLLPVAPVTARYVKLLIPATQVSNTPSFKTAIAEISVFTDEYPYKAVVDERSDFIPLDPSRYIRRAIGFYGDTQFRNHLEYPFYKEATRSTAVLGQEIWDWNNILSVEATGEGISLVKESQKTIFQRGHHTGVFICDDKGVSNLGWGVAPEEINASYHKCWANWTVVHGGTEEERQLAVKTFDRIRFPLTLPGHQEIYACSWGFGNKPNATGADKREGALEVNVLKELDASAKLGIETYLIDDGWQTKEDWKPSAEAYPQGWVNVVQKAKDNGMKLALWADVQRIKSEQLDYNQAGGGFVGWKFDFAMLGDANQIRNIEQKARNFIKKNDYKLSVQWDLTENVPRYGLFWGREYGVVWLENREASPQSIYAPSTTLRDAWELSTYVNVNKFQLPIRNVDLVQPPSDAKYHSQAYAVAVGMVGIPMFFEKMQSYDEADLAEIKPMLDIYKAERKALHQSYVFPIGERPCNASFTGFQAVHPSGKGGHLFLFRELFATGRSFDYQLKFLKNKKLSLLNLRDRTTTEARVNAEGFVTFVIAKPADFALYRYEVVE